MTPTGAMEVLLELPPLQVMTDAGPGGALKTNVYPTVVS
jgi:hypothetical protein